jgi:hypothetical protein
MIVPPIILGIADFILAPASPITAALGIMGSWLMYPLPSPQPLATARKARMTPAGQPASTWAPQSSGVDNKANLSFQPTERSKK